MIKTILIDDSIVANAFTSKVVADNGKFKVVKAFTDYLEALEYLISSDSIDLVLLDYHMPGIHFFEFMEKYHSLNVSPKPIVILLSGGELEIFKHIKNVFVTDFYRKPLDYYDLEEIRDNYFK